MRALFDIKEKRLKAISLAYVFGLTLCLGVSHEAWAVVGQAEKFDEVREQELKEFQEKLVKEEQDTQKEEQYEKTEEMEKTIKEKEGEMDKMEGKEKETIKGELQKLKKELLNLPKRDRLHFGISGEYTYDSNINRERPGHAKGESILDLTQNTEIDLSGKKTDLRTEFAWGRQWNIHFPENDFWRMEERVRYRRRYFTKLAHSVNSRVARTSERTIEIDNRRVRWDSNQQTSLNYLLTRKLSLNGDFSLTNRYFSHETFDQDSSWQVTLSPSLFWNFTPKSRASLGYSFGANRIRTKTGDSNSHEVHGGYFGKLTHKSSISADIGYSHQTPRSEDTETIDTITAGVGYIWQATPRTQLGLNYIYSLQNSTSDLVGSSGETVKTDDYFYNNSLAVSINTRLTPKITQSFNQSFSFTRNKSSGGGGAGSGGGGGQFTYPLSLGYSYLVNRWTRVRIAYTFAFRTGDEKEDSYIDHIMTAGIDLRF